MQSEIFQAYNFDDYGLQLMKILHNILIFRVSPVHKNSKWNFK